MTRFNSKLAAVVLLSAAAFPLIPGCDDGSGDGDSSAPKPGSYVYVQFKRNYLGLASDKPTTPMGEGMNMQLASSGEMKSLNDEFLVLKVDGEPGRELWIPRDVILMLDVRNKQE
jgi:hypothetical protein